MEGQTAMLPEGGSQDEGGGGGGGGIPVAKAASVDAFHGESASKEQTEQKHTFAAVRDQREVTGNNQQQQQSLQQNLRRSHGGISNKQNKKRFLRQQNKNKKWKMNKFKRNQKDNLGKKKEQAKGTAEGSGDDKVSQTGGNSEQKPQQGGKKHSNKNTNSLMQVRNKRLQAISKFFLPGKRPRKDCIIPPTKFLLGGNISDPLNLNSLQNESENAVTPKSSPIPTPPHYKNKIEVIIPPNINDPLHLLDPVDSVEYEMQLCSPMKKKQRARNKRKRKAKADKNNQSLDSSTGGNVSGQLGTNLPEAEATTAEEAQLDAHATGSKTAVDPALEGGNTGEKDRASRFLKLDLEICRKRRISESTCGTTKNKVRRMDSMDKIVSPVIPQPGAWKRNHWPAIPAGARNRTRTHSCTSVTDEPPAKQLSVEPEEILPTNTEDKKSELPIVSEPQTNPKSASQSEAKFHYGNYDRYYGYRNLNEFIDVRLRVFLRNPYLFRDKDVLDIGCNVGLLTIAVAKMLHTKSITGIDIDGQLIAKARRNLTSHVRIPLDIPEEKQVVEDKGKPVATKSSDVELKSELQTASSSKADAPKAEPKPAETASNETPPDSEQETKKSSTDISEHPAKSTCTKKGRNQQRRKMHGRYYGKHHPHHHHHHHHHHNHHQRHQQRNKDTNTRLNTEFFPISAPLSLGNLGARTCHLTIGSPNRNFPNNVIFKTMNYVLKDESLINYDTQQYDLILCLSVTKWIHLNFGDNGLKTAFKRMFNHLRPGGKLILEAQNWASYKKKKKLTKTTLENYNNIEFFPNRFNDYLLSPEIGFSHSYPLGIPRHLSKGFRRPIQLYVKGDFTPSQAQWSDTYHPQTPRTNSQNIYADVNAPAHNPCIWGSTTPYQPSYSTRCTPSSGFMATSPYYNPRETDSYQPSYDVSNRRGSYCFASPLYSTTWSPPSDLRNRRSASNTPNSASVRSVDNDEQFSGQQSGRHHVYPPMEVFSLDSNGRLPESSGSARHTDSDSELSSNSASQTPTRSIDQFDQSSNSPSTTNSQPDK
ncbi:7SK snRNA methylphosphate capping enzyme bin3 [Uranotaenia lowii]|uniref:7SK snRNA methylphosphate capping enzyme bin3 n=1 Tax=Uranotaenia lowii TaxID=190385 RepID=UPI002479829A|nr:7SK snRNA methylphosphate capping enzyme bin3 [Uranotaenia lowii]